MENVRIQDDLFHHVNGQWIETAVIPDDRPTAGGFADLAKGVEETLIADFKAGDVTDQNALALFNLVMDTKKRNKAGIRPVIQTANRIKHLKNVQSLNRALRFFIENGLPLPMVMSVEEDMMDTTKHCLTVQGPSTILPDTTYYKEDHQAQKEALLKVWSDMARAVLAKCWLSDEEVEQYIKDALAFDELIAGLVKSSQEWSEYTKCYNPTKARTFSSWVKPLHFRKVVEDMLSVSLEMVVVAEPRYFKGFKTVFNEDNFTLYKHWAYVTFVLSSCGLLSEELREIGGSYRRAMTGVAAMSSVEKYAYQLASSVYSQPVGLYYGQKYFGEKAKEDVTEMVKEIVKTYQSRIAGNDFLSSDTKQKAILKLSKMGLKLAYPDHVDPVYGQCVVDENESLFANMQKIAKIKRLNSYRKIDKAVDKSKWVMPGHMVNACYNPTLNDITFPAAILQAPFYSLSQTRSENLGGIGAVIAHEISHAFDNNGANCDENGNLRNWWTKEDFKKFKAKTKAMAKQFDGIELPWGRVNGEFIVSENIADNGGMAATLEIMEHMEDANFEEYFKNWARVWCIKAKPEYQKLLLSVDVHAPALLRCNMQPRNFEAWYRAFGVTKKDQMYLAPNKRITIW